MGSLRPVPEQLIKVKTHFYKNSSEIEAAECTVSSIIHKMSTCVRGAKGKMRERGMEIIEHIGKLSLDHLDYNCKNSLLGFLGQEMRMQEKPNW